MFPAKFELRVFQFILTGIMTLFVSGAVSLINLGLSGFTFAAWMQAWAPTWPVAFCVIIFATPIATKLASKLVKNS